MCVLHVYLSGAVSLIFHSTGGTTYRGQCFPEFYTYLFVVCLYYYFSFFFGACVCFDAVLQTELLSHDSVRLSQSPPPHLLHMHLTSLHRPQASPCVLSSFLTACYRVALPRCSSTDFILCVSTSFSFHSNWQDDKTVGRKVISRSYEIRGIV